MPRYARSFAVFLLCLLGLASAPRSAAAGCIDFTETGGAPKARICLDETCEDTTQAYLCSNATQASAGYANGIHVQEDVTSNGSTITILVNEVPLPREQYARITCNTLPDGQPCDFFPTSNMNAVNLNWLSSSSPLDGMCVQREIAGCDDAIAPFQGGRLAICGSTCRLSNPVNVRNMDATLYDLACSTSQSAAPVLTSDRVMVIKQTGQTGAPKLSFVTENWSAPIVPCP
ncbi:hypothetical protein ACN2XU_18050 [Primorskyibacter sp. 2E107]|uniref:hypothetical protein n=1 Tax=Primorskyibacter sp. 2E107 TaxID=3403458 RepID=UPI003AF60931